MENTNPKALNLDAVRMSDSNVTVGFKCPPELKLILAQEAERSGLTLSNYVSRLVDFEINELKELRTQNDILTNELEKTKSILSFYRNQILFDLFDAYKGETIKYFNHKGQEVNQTILVIEDVYSVIINSFKYKI